MRVAARLGFVIGVPVLLLCQLLASQGVTASQSAPVAVAGRQFTPDRRHPADDGERFMDMYGNEVTNAMAEYTLDSAGSLYELHSPQTELPHLAAPKT